MRAEAVAAVVVLGQRQSLELRAHRAIDDDDALAEERAEAAGSRDRGRRSGPRHVAVPEGAGRAACGISRRSAVRKRSAASTRPKGRLTW